MPVGRCRRDGRLLAGYRATVRPVDLDARPHDKPVKLGQSIDCFTDCPRIISGGDASCIGSEPGVRLPDPEIHDHIGPMCNNSSYELGCGIVFHAEELAASQSASGRVNVNTGDVDEALVSFEQCRRQRPQLAADSHNEEPLFSHEIQITESGC